MTPGEVRQSLRIHLAVGCGAALGALLRFAIGAGTMQGLGLPGFTATGVVNVLGSLVIGFVATISGPDGRLLLAPARRQFIMSGLCGGLTTFSAMSFDTFALLAGGRAAGSALYLVLVILLSLAAVWTGHALATRLNR